MDATCSSCTARPAPACPFASPPLRPVPTCPVRPSQFRRLPVSVPEARVVDVFEGFPTDAVSVSRNF
eukprot:3099479-Prymnesium_polylepis.1